MVNDTIPRRPWTPEAVKALASARRKATRATIRRDFEAVRKWILEYPLDELTKQSRIAQSLESLEILWQHMQIVGDIVPESIDVSRERQNKAYAAALLTEKSVYDVVTEAEILKAINDGIAWTKARVRPKKLPILSPTAALFYEILLALPPHRGLTAPQVLDMIREKDPVKLVAPETLRGRIKAELVPYGIDNAPRIGYFIKSSHRPE